MIAPSWTTRAYQIIKTPKACFYLLLVCFTSLGYAQNQNMKMLSIGGDFNYPPYEYLDSNQTPRGYNIDLSNEIGKILGLQIQFKLSKWSQVKTNLEEGEIDLIQGMALSPERARHYYFSLPHTQTWRSIFVNKQSRIKNVGDLRNARVVLQKGDIALDYLSWIDFYGTVTETATQEDALYLLSQKKFDAAILNNMHGILLMQDKKMENVSVLPQQIQLRDYCYASDDPELISRVNKALRILIGNGVLQKLHDKWFPQQPSSNAKPLVTLLPNPQTIVPVLIAFLILIIWPFRIHRRNRRTILELKSNLNEKNTIAEELQQEHSLFIEGPVVLYKLIINPLEFLTISPNVSQWGYQPDEIISLDAGIMQFVHPEDQQKLQSQLLVNPDSWPTGKVNQYRIRTKNGDYRWIFDYSVIQLDKNGRHICLGYLLDITQRIVLENDLTEEKLRAEAASIAKGHFLANMSHEIRTPLNGILGLIEVLQRMDCGSEMREILEMISISGQSLHKIVTDILDISKIESGKLELVASNFDPHFLLENVVKGFSVRNEKAGIDLRCMINDQVPKSVIGDLFRLRQILVNLIQNAVKFTNVGWIEVTADVYTITDKEVRLLIKVADTGIGIESSQIEKIFDTFGQTDKSITGNYGGTGLGLSIVKRLVELMNGFIWVESSPGHGSTFFMILPFMLCDDTSAQAVVSHSKFPPLPKVTALIVDDDLISQKVLKHQLENWNLNVILANNGELAIQKLSETDIDFVLMDVQMPVMDGIKATEFIRSSKNPYLRNIPICAVTAAAMAEDKQRCLAAGMDHYISKPIDLSDLYYTIKLICTAISKDKL